MLELLRSRVNQHAGEPAQGVGMDYLWAPWRSSYVTQSPKTPQSSECFICQGLGQPHDRENLIVWRSNHTCVFLNRYPYNNGHLLIAPRHHKARLDQLTPDEMHDCHHVMSRFIRIFEKRMTPDGFNIGLNMGRVAGAGLPGHLHWHLVPRWTGDANFMTVVSETRVISQSLQALYDLIQEELAGEYA